MASSGIKLTHSELARRVAARTGLSIRHAQMFLSEAGDAIGAALAEGHSVHLFNLGVLSASVSHHSKVMYGKPTDVVVPYVCLRASRKLKNRLKTNSLLEKAEASGK